MASSVLLDDDVRLVAITGEKTGGGGSMSSFIKPLRKLEKSGGGGGSIMSYADRLRCLLEEEEEEPKGLVDWVREGKVKLVPDNPYTNPPAISTLSLHLPATPREISAQLGGVRVTSADNNLLVLSTGPVFDDLDSAGHYLVYDAASGDLILAPQIAWSELREIYGCTPVVMRCGQGSSDFTLAIVLLSRRTKKHVLLRWSHSTSTGKRQQWEQFDASLPDDILEYPFMTDVAFAFQGWCACWVDLYLGIMACDVLSLNPHFHLVPLPEDYQMNFLPMARGRPDVYSTMGCVNGKIKFLYMDDYVNSKCPRDKVTMATWTLRGTVPSPGLCKWQRDDYTMLRAGDLWAEESFHAIPGLPQRPPMCPVLSPKEPDMVYFFMSDLSYEDGHTGTKGEYMLGLNLRSKKVLSWCKCPPGRSLQLFPSFIAAELRASSGLDDQGNVPHHKRRK